MKVKLPFFPFDQDVVVSLPFFAIDEEVVSLPFLEHTFVFTYSCTDDKYLADEIDKRLNEEVSLLCRLLIQHDCRVDEPR